MLSSNPIGSNMLQQAEQKFRLFDSYRCGQPAQQHGRRMPPLSLDSALLMRIPRVSAFLPEVTQQIHSLRASGVISAHTARAFGSDEIAFRKSAGTLCTAPAAIPFLIINTILPNQTDQRGACAPRWSSFLFLFTEPLLLFCHLASARARSVGLFMFVAALGAGGGNGFCLFHIIYILIK